MFKNYFVTAWRNLIRDRSYSLFNILGLAVGMGVALLIGLWINYHLSYDRILPDHELAYRAMVRSSPNGMTNAGYSSCLPLAEAIRKDVPGVRYVARAD